jgi:hypothetical protein
MASAASRRCSKQNTPSDAKKKADRKPLSELSTTDAGPAKAQDGANGRVRILLLTVF